MTIEVGKLSKLVNRVFRHRPQRLTDSMILDIMMTGTQFSATRSDDQLWEKMRGSLAKGANPGARSSLGDTALEKLCEDRHHGAALKLLQEYPDLEVGVARKPTPITPLMYALRDAHPALVRALCEHGADVNGAIADGAKNITALDFLFNNLGQAGNPDILDCMKTLVDHGLVPTDENKRRIFTKGQLLAKYVPDVQEALDFCDALRKGDNAGLAQMLQNGASYDTGVQWGANSALAYAANHGNTGAIDLLIAHGAPVNATIDDNGATALHMAAIAGQREACLKLLQAGADPRALWKSGNGALIDVKDAAARSNDSGMAEFLQNAMDARETKAAPEVNVNHEIKVRRPFTLKK